MIDEYWYKLDIIIINEMRSACDVTIRSKIKIKIDLVELLVLEQRLECNGRCWYISHAMLYYDIL
jgi:hypothetical protein